jgi:hypothetical protein
MGISGKDRTDDHASVTPNPELWFAASLALNVRVKAPQLYLHDLGFLVL